MLKLCIFDVLDWKGTESYFCPFGINISRFAYGLEIKWKTSMNGWWFFYGFSYPKVKKDFHLYGFKKLHNRFVKEELRVKLSPFHPQFIWISLSCLMWKFHFEQAFWGFTYLLLKFPYLMFPCLFLQNANVEFANQKFN